MKIRFSEVPAQTCFFHGRKGQEKKKLEDGKVATIGKSGKVSMRPMKGNPKVEQKTCSLRYLAVGLRRHPDEVVEIGDGNILKRRRR